MESSKADVESLRAEAKKADSCLYTDMQEVEFYNDLMREYWDTIDDATVYVPQIKKLAKALKKIAPTADAIEQFHEGAALLKQSSGKIRPTQDGPLVDVLTEKVDLICLGLVTEVVKVNATDADRLTAFFDAVAAVCPKVSVGQAKKFVANLVTAEKEHEGVSKLLCTIRDFTAAVDACQDLGHIVGDAALTRMIEAKSELASFESDVLLIPKVKQSLSAIFNLLSKEEFDPSKDVFSLEVFQTFGDLLFLVAAMKRVVTKAGCHDFDVACGNYESIVKHWHALIAFFRLGPSQDVRLQKDPSLSVTSQVPGAIKVVLETFAPTPGWLQRAVRQCTNEFDQVGQLEIKLRIARANAAIKALDLVKMVPLKDGAKGKGDVPKDSRYPTLDFSTRNDLPVPGLHFSPVLLQRRW